MPDRTIKGTIRANSKAVMQVIIVLKRDQRTGTLTNGTMKDLLTGAPAHHRGIKVRLHDGHIGLVQKNILDEFNAFYAAVCNACICIAFYVLN